VGAAECTVLCGPEASARVRSPFLRAARLSGTGSTKLPDWGSIRGVTVIDGTLRLRGAFGELLVPRGSTAALPAGLTSLDCELERGHAILSSVVA
jgi:hypothetical protein